LLTRRYFVVSKYWQGKMKSLSYNKLVDYSICKYGHRCVKCRKWL